MRHKPRSCRSRKVKVEMRPIGAIIGCFRYHWWAAEIMPVYAGKLAEHLNQRNTILDDIPWK